MVQRFQGFRPGLTFGARLWRGCCDEYIAFCEAEGKTPDVPFKGSFNVRIPQDLHQRAALYAEEHNLKLNAVVQLALKEW